MVDLGRGDGVVARMGKERLDRLVEGRVGEDRDLYDVSARRLLKRPCFIGEDELKSSSAGGGRAY